MDKIGLRQVLPDVFADNPPVGSEIWRRDVTFDKGRVYLVEAASGSGKSSFCGYLYGYRRDYSGTILFDDRDIRELRRGVERPALPFACDDVPGTASFSGVERRG